MKNIIVTIIVCSLFWVILFSEIITTNEMKAESKILQIKTEVLHIKRAQEQPPTVYDNIYVDNEGHQMGEHVAFNGWSGYPVHLANCELCEKRAFEKLNELLKP